MPEVIVRAGSEERGPAPVLLRERITDANLESPHYAEQLIERIGWAVMDAAAAERGAEDADQAS